MAPQAATQLPQDIAQHHRLVSPGTLLALVPCKPPGVVQHLRCAKICACAYSHAKYWSGLSLFWWCLRRGDLDGTDVKYLNVVDQGKQCILI